MTKNSNTRFAIVGYGNLGRAAEKAIVSRGGRVQGIYTRRDPAKIDSPYMTPALRQEEIFDHAGEIDMALVCLGSASDTVDAVKRLARNFNTADTFDTHSKIPSYFEELDAIAKDSGHISLISAGWDPGIFSMMRALFAGVLGVKPQTFWGRGISQGHSEAVRHIEGVLDARQYTIPNEDAMRLAREGYELGDGERHKRECYVALKEGADKDRVEREIKTMPDYFAPYRTEVRFVDKDTLIREHGALPHAGRVIAAGDTGGYGSRLELELEIKSNPDFTAHVLVNYAEAALKMFGEGRRGALTALDVPISRLVDNGLSFV